MDTLDILAIVVVFIVMEVAAEIIAEILARPLIELVKGIFRADDETTQD